MSIDASSRASGELQLAELLEHIMRRLQEGEAFDLGRLQREFPDAATQLAELLPAAKLLAELGVAEITKDRGLSLGAGHIPAPEKCDESGSLGSLGDFRILRELGRGGMGASSTRRNKSR